jgi:hypothetical protein
VEESELDQRVSDWLEHHIEIEHNKKDKSHGKLQDTAVEEQKAHRAEMTQIFSEKAAGKSKVEEQTAASESQKQTDYMMDKWHAGMKEVTGDLGKIFRKTFGGAGGDGSGVGGGAGRGDGGGAGTEDTVTRGEFEQFTTDQRELHRRMQNEQRESQKQHQRQIMDILRRLVPNNPVSSAPPPPHTFPPALSSPYPPPPPSPSSHMDGH